MSINVKNFQSLLAWLDAGAPEYIFDMSEAIDRVHLDKMNDFQLSQAHAKGIGECGTVCCIAGHVAIEAGWASADRWEDIRDVAMKRLGLPQIPCTSFIRVNPDLWFGHPLFSNHLAPENCTPAQAAQAVRNTMADPTNPNPWEGVE